MALKPKTQKKIEQSLRRFVAYLKYRSVGPHALTRTELKDLAREGMIGANGAPKTAIARAYLKLHGQMTVEPAPKSMRDGAIDFLERMFSRYADKAGEGFTNDLLNQIEANLMPIKDRVEGKQVYDVLKDKDLHQKHLGRALKDTVENWSNRWKLIVNTELARASNYGALDAIVHNNKGTAPTDITVFKIGPSDSAVCDQCKKFWFLDDFVTPRVYRLSELIANGTNIGRRRIDWKPTIDNTHPGERHLVLQELRPGYGFEKSGLIMYQSKDHDEYGLQRNNTRIMP